MKPNFLRDAGVPIVVFLIALAAWEAIVRIKGLPPYILPAPSVILAKLVEDRELLFSSLMVTLGVTAKALVIATLSGVGLALLIAQSKWLERALLPFAVILQVTPIIAIAPLLLVYLEPSRAVLVCAFLVAFFPILSNTSLGLASIDHGLQDLFDLYHASAWQRLIYLRLPGALPSFSPDSVSVAALRSWARLSQNWRRAPPDRAAGSPFALSRPDSVSISRECSRRSR